MALVESSQQLGSPQQWTPFSVAFMKIDRFITKEQAQPGSFEDFQDIISQLQRRNFVTNINLVRFFNKSIEELQTKNEQKALRNLATTFFGKSNFYSYATALSELLISFWMEKFLFNKSPKKSLGSQASVILI
jgi:hypothetical protein